MKFPGHFTDDGEPARRTPEAGRPKRLTADRIEAIARFVEDRELGSRNEPASGIRHRFVTIR